MYAIIKTGGKQYRVTEGQVVHVEKLTSNVGQEIEFGNVLMVSQGEGQVHIGAPCLEKATVTGEIIDQARAPKIKIIKFKRRKQHLKQQGHRQYYTAVKIKRIALDEAQAS